MLPARVLIVIVNYRTAALALDAVASLEPEVLHRGDAHVVVIDNGSGDGSADTIAAGITAQGFGTWCTLVAQADNRGFSAGNNAGIAWYRQAAGALPDYVWLLNPDTRALPDAIGALVRFLDARPDVGIAGGRCLWEDGGVWTGAFRFHSPCSEFVDAVAFGPLTRLMNSRAVALPPGDAPAPADWVSGASMMIRRAAIERIGPMDEGYFLYFEETDYCARLIDQGFTCWTVPASRVTHIGGQSTGVTGEQRRPRRRPPYWFASRARFFRRHWGTPRTHLANFLWLAAYPLGGLIAAARGRRRNDPPAFWRDFLLAYYGPGGLMYKPAAQGGGDA